MRAQIDKLFREALARLAAEGEPVDPDADPCIERTRDPRHGVEVLVALYFLGFPVSWTAAWMITAVVCLVRAALFFVQTCAASSVSKQHSTAAGTGWSPAIRTTWKH
jgi:hypothetical protein